MSVVQTAKAFLEKTFKCKIYRDSLPRGSDFFSDLATLRAACEFTTVIDVGAHRGESLGKYLGHFRNAKIFALEPSKESFGLLKQQFGIEPRVTFFNEAAGAATGTATLFMKTNTSTHSLRPAAGVVGEETVNVTTLDAFCEREKIETVSLCKIDTEGADMQVLQGAEKMLAAQRIHLVQVEASTRHDTDYFSSFFEMSQLLAKHNYELFGIYEQMPCWTGRQSILFFNAVFVASSVVNHLPPWDDVTGRL